MDRRKVVREGVLQRHFLQKHMNKWLVHLFNRMGSVSAVKQSYLWWIALIYFCAFSSVYFQIPGLYGDNGILPIKHILKTVTNENINERPTLLWLAPVLGYSYSEMFDVLCLGGMAVSLLIMTFSRDMHCFNYLLLWILYYSIYQVGQTFLHFQWDILLLEASFLAVIMAPLRVPFLKSLSPSSPHDEITVFLVRWLFFRLMFASGVVKLTSLCPTWWGLTALNYHFESQCIPTAFAWIFHHFPEWFLKLSVVMTFVIEIGIPLLFFSPIRCLRIFSYWSQVLLQVLIIMTGNYTFFNVLTLTLALSLVDDGFLIKQHSSPKRRSSWLSRLVFIVVIIAIIWLTVYLFSMRITKDGQLSTKINFSKEQFSRALNKSVPVTIWIGVISLTAHIFHSIYVSLKMQSGIFGKLKALMSTCFISIIAIFMFCISCVPHTQVDSASYRSIWPVVNKWHNSVSHLELVHAYGLFRRMTGVEGRPEIIIEGSHSIHNGWKEYQFKYKPGNMSECPKFVAPHQPRLDWQMWFAALGSYHHNPWFINLIYRLLQGKQEVLDLLGPNPFAHGPPTYIRAVLYTYQYTEYDPHVRRSSDWWQRSNPNQYMPVLTKDNPSLQQYLQQSGFEQETQRKEKVTNLTVILDAIRGVLSSLSAPVFMWAVCLLALIARYTS